MFSNPLKKRLVSYFACRYKVDITEAEAEEFLHCLADLYVALSEVGGTATAAHAAEPSDSINA